MMSEARNLRKTTYRLYPTPKQTVALDALLRSHQQLYNAALEERISAWSKAGKSISYADQCKSLTVLRRDLPEWADAANCSSQQMTLRRLDKAFGAFFRRVKAGQTPGFPRFKSLGRFSGFSFKSHGDGWRFTPEDGCNTAACACRAWVRFVPVARPARVAIFVPVTSCTAMAAGICR